MDLEIIILSEVSQTEKDKYHGNIYMWNQRKGYKWAYRQYKNRVIDVEIKHSYQGVRGLKCKLGDWDWHIYTAVYKIDN